ncbi:nitroreductase family protein [Streptomyces griseosporeus]|uniref:tpaF n=1 Tax=Streptomyces griseosporeus TaxID=1910 RepID=UPI0036F4BC23
MRSDLSTMRPLLDGFASRTPTSDGLSARRTPVPFPDAEPAADQGAEAGRDLHDTLLGRRSSLRYADAPVRTGLVLHLLKGALGRDSGDWGLDDAAGPLEAFVFALRSEGMPPGVYRVTAEEASFVAPAAALGDPEDLGVQREFATAGGIVSMYAALDRADAWAGAHGYRVSVTRASMALYDFHLRCQAHGLVGTLFGGFIGSAVRTVVHSDGVTRHPLLSATYALPEAEA